MVRPIANTTTSFALSLSISILLFGVLHLGRSWFVSVQMHTILGGLIGSWIFILLLTAISNLEQLIYGDGFQAKFLPEIGFCLISACSACGIVHRVCATTCILFSMLGLYFVNKISQSYYNSQSSKVQETSTKRRRK